MVSTWHKVMSYALVRKDAATKMELPWKHAAVQTSGCRDCQSLLLLWDDSGDICVRCDYVDDLLSLVAELTEEVERLSIRVSEKEIGKPEHHSMSLRQE